MKTGITIDGLHYRVQVTYDSLIRAFEIIEGSNSGTMLTGRYMPDILGTGFSFEMEVEPDPLYPQDYDSLYEVVSAPVPSHMVTVPYGQANKTFEVRITGGKDTYHGRMSGHNRWGGLTLSMVYIAPSRTR